MEEFEKTYKDFEHEISVNKFPFHEIILDSKTHKGALFTEFAKLTAKPKFHLYFTEHISEEEWMKACTETPECIKQSDSSQIIAANFVAKSDIELKAEELFSQFQNSLITNTIEAEFYGRFIDETDTVKVLKKINNEVENFTKYVFNDSRVDNYSIYARAVAKKIISLTNNLEINGLKIDLLKSITNMDFETDLNILLFTSDVASSDHSNLKRNFSYLKTIADEIFNDEILANKKQNDLLLSLDLEPHKTPNHSRKDLFNIKAEADRIPEPGISFQNADKLYTEFFDAYYSIYLQLTNNEYDPKKQLVLYNETLDTDFLADYKYMVINNLANKEGLNAFIKDVYYNKVIHLLTLFKKLSIYRLAQLQNDYGLAVEDHLFTLIENGYMASLKNVAEQIRTWAIKHKLDDLTFYTQVTSNDYNISGEYIPLLQPEKNITATQQRTIETIFRNSDDWAKYILPLTKTSPPLLSPDMQFIGKKMGHKGVICSWFKDLQNRGVIQSNLNRKTLAEILNKAFKDFNLGSDGKSFDNVSKRYDHDFKSQLEKLVS